jgi:hypothetical protein
MSILDDILKMVDDSDEFTDSEKAAIKKKCSDDYNMEMGGGEE